MNPRQINCPRINKRRNGENTVSDTDSFINEVTEEVRNDQLFGYVKKYGWIAVTLILVLVGGAAYSEWTKAQNRAAAETAGDALLDALAHDDVADRAAALAEVTTDGPAAAVTGLLTAAAQQNTGDLAGAKATLDSLAANEVIPQAYRDVAVFKSATIAIEGEDTAARRQTLENLATPGLPYRLMALEQIAMMDVDAGDIDAAVTGLQAIVEDAAVSRGLRDRAQTLMIALGAELEPAAAE
jgi:hypothetical protein